MINMKNIFKPGDIKTHRFTVKSEDVAKFEAGEVHPVCSTFTLAREMEWSSRLFVLEMTEEHEEGIGTFVNVSHRSPALVGQELSVSAKVTSFERNELICEIEVKCGDRLVAIGSTGQKILPKNKIKEIFSSLEKDGE